MTVSVHLQRIEHFFPAQHFVNNPVRVGRTIGRSNRTGYFIATNDFGVRWQRKRICTIRVISPVQNIEVFDARIAVIIRILTILLDNLWGKTCQNSTVPRLGKAHIRDIIFSDH